MTYEVGMKDVVDDYEELGEIEDGQMSGSSSSSGSCFSMKRGSLWWLKLILLCVLSVVLVFVVVKWGVPFLIDKVVIPVINWETAKFSTSELGVIVFASVAVFPVFFLPSIPSMWVAGITFGYGFGFLIIMPGVIIGVSLPYFIGSLFHRKIQKWMEKYPKRASVLRLAGEGSWFRQSRAVALIRITPFPYVIYNYCAVATNVHFVPYFLGSLVGMVPEVFLSIYTGIMIRTLADATHGSNGMSPLDIILNVCGFCATVAVIILFTFYAKRKLKELRNKEKPLLK